MLLTQLWYAILLTSFLDVSCLPLAQAAALSELEGTAITDDGKGCGPAFVVLRNLAQAWLDDASKHSNMYVFSRMVCLAGLMRGRALCKPMPLFFLSHRCADALLLNLYPWVCSPSSQLFDPALKQVRKSKARSGRDIVSPQHACHILSQKPLCRRSRH